MFHWLDRVLRDEIKYVGLLIKMYIFKNLNLNFDAVMKCTGLALLEQVKYNQDFYFIAIKLSDIKD